MLKQSDFYNVRCLNAGKIFSGTPFANEVLSSGIENVCKWIMESNALWWTQRVNYYRPKPTVWLPICVWGNDPPLALAVKMCSSLIRRFINLKQRWKVHTVKPQPKRGKVTMPTTVKDLTLYSVFDVSRMLNVTTVSVRNYIKQGYLNGQKLMGRWFVTEEDLNSFFNRLT